MRRLFFLLALGNLLAVGWVIWDETVTRRPWKAVQDDMNRRLRARGEPSLPIEIRQTAAAEPGAVDRCVTCHLAIDTPRAGWDAGAPPHLRLHPRRDELLGAHPVERFGCTGCHDGQGTQTKGTARATFAHGRDDPYWERPLREGAFVQASCLLCHDTPPRGAPALARGRALYQDLRCGACHTASFVPPVAGPSAPPLAGLVRKSGRSFVESWLRAPRDFRPDTRMPAFWPPPTGATGAALPPAAPEAKAAAARRDGEVAAIVDFLASLPAPALPPITLPARLDDPALVASGRALFDRVGCRGCHRLSPEPAGAEVPVPDERRAGPVLDRIGEKATAAWLAAWLRAPHEIWPAARMPSLRLSDAELGALVAFLVAERLPGAPAATADWRAAVPPRVDEGRALVAQYGCAGCHELPSVGRTGRSGPDLDAFGDKNPEEVSFGDAALDCGKRSRLECFAVEKLRTPRRFVGAGVERLLMPDYRLAPDDAQALAVFVMAQRSSRVATTLRRPATPAERAVAAGEDVLRVLNCRGCHEIGREVRPIAAGPGAGAGPGPASPGAGSGSPGASAGVGSTGETEIVPTGGAIRSLLADLAMAPPSLTFAGEKLDPTWLVEFLRAPRVIRPWLGLRMPTFSWDAARLDAVARGFAARSGAPYPDIGRARPVLPPGAGPDEARRLFDKLLCSKCHPRSGATGAGSLATGDLAPDLALVKERLRPAWVRAWIADPQSFDAETRMPAYFGAVPDPKGGPAHIAGLPGFMSGDGAAQVDALVWLLYQ